jgi:hypothetical protein
MGEENEGIKREKRNGDETDKGRQFPPHHHFADHVHYKEDKKKGCHGGQEIGGKVIQPGGGNAIPGMNEDVWKYEGPAKERDISDAPERMQETLPRSQFREEDEDQAFYGIPSEPGPVVMPPDAQIAIIQEDENHEEKGTQKVEGDFPRGILPPPVVELFLLFLPQKHGVLPKDWNLSL